MPGKWLVLMLAAATLSAGCAGQAPRASSAAPAASAEEAYTVPVHYRVLDNGLKVVVSPDDTAPIATVAVYYKVGLRSEPKGLTGFSHLFEHMMFQSSENLPKGAFDKLVQGNGGVLQGQTKYDVTLYYEVVPTHMIEPVLWAEADRMGRLTVNQENLDNQREVVKNEVRLKIENQPYSEFISVEITGNAYENWQNNHNSWGEMADLDAATVEAAEAFYETYYAPNNAVIVVVGDVEPGTVFAMVEKHFGEFPAREQPSPPDLSEPRQEAEKRSVFHDPLAPQPALAFAYHIPERGTPEYYAMGMIDLILLRGQDSLLHQRLVREKGYVGFVGGGINLQGNMFDYDGHMIWTGYTIFDASRDPEQLLAEIDDVVEGLRTTPVDRETLDRALLKFRSGFYDTLGSGFGTGRANLLAAFALFDDDPSKINQILDRMSEVTPERIRSVAQEYLRPSNRTVVFLEPGAAEGGRP
jgi:predicted Zn-dependent peptidase